MIVASVKLTPKPIPFLADHPAFEQFDRQFGRHGVGQNRVDQVDHFVTMGEGPVGGDALGDWV